MADAYPHRATTQWHTKLNQKQMHHCLNLRKTMKENYCFERANNLATMIQLENLSSFAQQIQVTLGLALLCSALD